MTLIFQSEYKSIKWINSIELPSFTLLIGKNGSWKSHFLQAIKEWRIQYNNAWSNDVALFSFEDFLIKNQNKISKWTIDGLKKWIRNNFQNDRQKFINIDNQIKNIYNSEFPYQQKIGDPQYSKLIQNVVDAITRIAWKNLQFKALWLSWVLSSSTFFTDLTEEEFYQNANFDEFDYSLMTNLSEIFVNYAVELAIQRNRNKLEEITDEELLKYEENSPWSFVNKIFMEFWLPHEITYPEFDLEKAVRVGQNLEFQVQLKIQDEIIDFESLSSGERILCALAITLFQNSKEHFPNVVLLDEVDTFLHPSMIQNLINVIQGVFLEKWCKVILTSHSPTTVALVEEESIFEMQPWVIDEKIRKISQFNAIDLLSEWFATFSWEKIMFENIINSTKDIILYVEWPTDIIHINKAKEKLWITLEYDIFHCRDAWRLWNFLKSIPQWLFQNKKIIWIFDFDGEGKKWVKIWSEQESEKHYIHREDESIHAITLPIVHEDLIKIWYCPIEFLYKKEYLDRIDWLLIKRHLREINSLSAFTECQIWQVEFENIKELWAFKVSDERWKKANFANSIDTFDDIAFENFQPLFEKISEISQ